MRVVICNCPVAKAGEIAKTLVQEKIAACVNIIPGVKSFYFWEGKLCEDEESTLLIKLRKSDFSVLEKRINELHPYDVPEIVALNVTDVNGPYCDFVYQMTKRNN